MNPDFDKLKEAPIQGLLGLGGGVTAKVVPIGGGSEYFYLKTTSNAGYNTGGWRNAAGILPFGSDGDCYIFYTETSYGKSNIARMDKVGKIQWSRRLNLSTWADGNTGANDMFSEATVSPYNSNNWAIIRTKETSSAGSFTSTGWMAHGAVNTSGGVEWGRQRAMPDQSSISANPPYPAGVAVTLLRIGSFWGSEGCFKTLHANASSDVVLDCGTATQEGSYWKNPWNGANTKNTCMLNFKPSDGTKYGQTVARQVQDPSNYWSPCTGGNVSGSTVYTGWQSSTSMVAGRISVSAGAPTIQYPRYWKNQYPVSPWNIGVQVIDVHSNHIMGRYTYPSSNKQACALLTVNNWNNGSNSSPISLRSDDHVYPMGFARQGNNYVYRLRWRKSNGNYQMVLQRGHSGNTDWTRTFTVNDGSEWNINGGGGPITIANDKMYFSINKSDKGIFVVLPWDTDGPELGTYGDLTISGAPSGWVNGGGGTGWGNNGTGKDPGGNYRTTHYSVSGAYAMSDNPVSNISSGLPTVDTTTVNTETEDMS
jgi:hypothetical protein